MLLHGSTIKMKQSRFTEIKAQVEQAIDAIARGEMVLVTDSVQREDEADLIMAAEHATPEKLARMVRDTTGIVCVSLMAQRLEELKLEQMVQRNNEAHSTAFTVTVDYRHGTTTGVSAKDRTRTILGLIDSKSKAEDFLRPGHLFPLRYTPGGVLSRRGHTEAALDLSRFARCYPAGVLCELVAPDGSMARGAYVRQYAQENQIPLISIEQLIEYSYRYDDWLDVIVESRIPTKWGEFRMILYRSKLDQVEHCVLFYGEAQEKELERPILLRIHSECLTGDLFQSLRCDCGVQLEQAMMRIAEEGYGMLIYLKGHEGRGIGLASKMMAYNLQDQGKDTVDANLALGFAPDLRDYYAAVRILELHGIERIRLMTNNPEKVQSLENSGFTVERVGLHIEPNKENRCYLEAKRVRLNHQFEEVL
jgi:3,4-dihydroxy 2-butanone 4-phosphate synthase/GTP cyclohydrolase II